MIDSGSFAALRHFPALMAVLGLILVGRVTAQTFTTLYSFAPGSGYPSYTNADGVYPGGLIISSNTLYGTASKGGIFGNGTVFRLNIDGSGFTNLHNFTARSAPYYTNEGSFAGLVVLSGNTLYGAAHEDGPLRNGTIFTINTDGSGFTHLYNFPYATNGVFPAGLVLSSNTFYGTSSGGRSGHGAVFKVNIDGSDFTHLYSFSETYWNPTVKRYTNSDGFFPGGLILSGNSLYGTAYMGGASDQGTVFKVNTDGTGFTNLHNFTPTDPITGANEDGVSPVGLIISGDTLYGVASAGGSSAHGTLYRVNTDGTGFTTLHSFTAFGGDYYSNADGAVPYGVLTLSGDTLFGLASQGGLFGRGTVFAVNIDGSDFEVLHSFRSGYGHGSSLILRSNMLYGTTAQDLRANGTVFSLSFLRRHRIISFWVQPTLVTIAWGTEPGRTYYIDYKPALTTEDWIPVSGAIVAQGTQTSWAGSRPSGSTAFYRVVMLGN
jgi:uncharacterized repeat protein (TIGR03803 family)